MRRILAVALLVGALGGVGAADVNMVTPEGRVVAVPESAEAQALSQGYKLETAEHSSQRIADEVRRESEPNWGAIIGIVLGAAAVAWAIYRYGKRYIAGGRHD